ncbi:MAG: peptide chain release factor N(5)-glutamine methyltransferase [Proteobacteria bacterium]|nr:peptide chain release factor N(5)-glutamine methyltransferase [Pseudomonadota bacterium]
MTLAELLRAAQAQGVARSDALGLMGHVLGRERTWLIAHDDHAPDAGQRQAIEALLARRAAGEPYAYLVGQREFFGLTLAVSPAVLVPRPETELLVAWALAVCPQPARVLDLGTGSGAIALALASRGLAVTATDASAAALAVAGANGQRLGLTATWQQGSWWQAVQGAPPFDLIVSNPPYVAEGDAHLAALRHEPIAALTAGLDGLADLRTIVAEAPAHLKPGGWLLLEHGFDQGPAVRALLAETGFAAIQTRPDLAGLDRCSGGRYGVRS